MHAYTQVGTISLFCGSGFTGVSYRAHVTPLCIYSSNVFAWPYIVRRRTRPMYIQCVTGSSRPTVHRCHVHVSCTCILHVIHIYSHIHYAHMCAHVAHTYTNVYMCIYIHMRVCINHFANVIMWLMRHSSIHCPVYMRYVCLAALLGAVIQQHVSELYPMYY